MTQTNEVERILAAWAEQRLSGAAPDPAEILRRHPEHAEALRPRLRALQFLDVAVDGTSADAPPIPESIGEYRILREIGRGGMGVVFEAQQTSMRRRVALKVLPLSITSAPEAVRRFRREAHAAGTLQHTNIVPVHGLGEQDGHWYYAMELVRGRSLDTLLAGGGGEGSASPSWDEESDVTLESGCDGDYHRHVARMFAGVGDALDLAHRQGIVHRDVKPGNLILSDEGALKIIDFGLAALEDADGSLTRTGNLLGTPHYMSPEQIRGKRDAVGPATDTYSLGVTLYEVLTRTKPFDGESPGEIVRSITTDDARDPRHVDSRIQRDLTTIVLKAMEKDPRDRYATTGDLARDLERFAAGAAVHARPIGVVERAWRRVKRHKVRSALVATVFALALMAGYWAIRSSTHAAEAREAEYARLLLLARDQLSYGALRRSGGPLQLEAGSRFLSSSDTAAGRLGEAIRVDPSRPDAWWWRALAPGRSLGERRADLAQARARGWPDRLVRLADVQLAVLAGVDPAQRADALLKQLGPVESPLERFLRAEVTNSMGDPDTALEQLDRVVDETPEGDPTHLLARMARAELHADRGDWVANLIDLQAVRAFGAGGRHVDTWIASSWRKLGQEEQADQLFGQTLDRARTDGRAADWIGLASACRQRGHLDWLDRATQVAVDALPHHAVTVALRAQALDFLGRPEEGLVLLDGHREARRSTLGIEWTRAYLLLQTDRLDEAEPLLRSFLDHAGVAHAATERLSRLHLQRGDHDEALELLDRAKAQDRTCSSCSYWRGKTLEAAGRTDDAIEAYRESLRLRATNSVAWLDLGVLLGNERGQHEEALHAFRQAIRLRPERDDGWENAVRSLSKLERRAEALELLEEALTVHPRHAGLRAMKASSLRENGRLEDIVTFVDGLDDPDVGLQVSYVDALLELGRVDDAARRLESLEPLEDPRLRLQLARLQLNAGRPSQALGIVQALHAEDLETWGSRNLEAIALRKLGKPTDAVRAFDAGIRLADAEAEGGRAPLALRVNKAVVLMQELRRPGAALAVLDEILERDETHAPGWLHRGRALRLLRRPAEALEALDHGVSIAPRHAGFRHQRGMFHLEVRGDAKKALEDFTVWTELVPSQERAWWFQGVALQALKRYADALTAFETCVHRGGSSYHPFNRKAQVLRHLGRHEEAVAAVRRALEIDANARSNHQLLGMCLRSAGRHEELIEHHKEILKRWPRDPQLLMDLGTARRALGRLEAAIEAFDAALAVREDLAWASLERAKALRDLGREDEATEAFRATLRIASDWLRAHNAAGNHFAQIGLHEEAERTYTRAMEMDPEDATAAVNRALLFMELGRLGEAVEDARSAVEIAPSWEATHGTLALVLWNAGRQAEALPAYEAAYALAPDHPRVVDHVTVLIQLRRYGDALAWIRRALPQCTDEVHLRDLEIVALRALGQEPEARRAAHRLLEDWTGEDSVHRAYAAAVAGREDEAREIFARLDEHAPALEVYAVAIVHAVLGDADGVVRSLERALEAGFTLQPNAAPWPAFEPLLEDPRVGPLLDRLPRSAEAMR